MSEQAFDKMFTWCDSTSLPSSSVAPQIASTVAQIASSSPADALAAVNSLGYSGAQAAGIVQDFQAKNAAGERADVAGILSDRGDTNHWADADSILKQLST